MSYYLYVIFYIFLLFSLFVERFFRYGDEAKSLSSGDTDKGSTKLLSLSFGICITLLLVSIVLNYYLIGNLLPETFFIIAGLICMIVGLLIRILAVRTLGSFYTSTLKTNENQTIVDTGMYAFIRHPGYLGNLILFFGAALAFDNVLVLLLILIILFLTYKYRITFEEQMLVSFFGEQYEAYKLRTKKIFPFIY